MTVSGWKRYVPLCTPALQGSDNKKVDAKLLIIRTFFVALAAIAASLAASYAKVNFRTIAKFVAPPAVCIVIGDIMRTFYATSHSSFQHTMVNGSSSTQNLESFPFKNTDLTIVFDRIMQLPEDERRQAVYDQIAFNKDKWEGCLGEHALSSEDIRLELDSLPSNIAEILNSPCPAFSQRRVIDTHMLVRVPKTLGGGISVNNLGVLLNRFFQNNTSGYQYILPKIDKDFGNLTIEKSYWVLMLKEPLLNSGFKTYVEQQRMIRELDTESSYEVPTLIEAITCMLAQYVGFGRCLYENRYMRVQETVNCVNVHSQTVFGGFSRPGLIDFNRYDYVDVVAGALRKFGP